MLKIIHLLDTIRFGGAESVALNYARLAAESGHKSTLCGKIESADFKLLASKYATVSKRFSIPEIRRADVVFVHSNRNLLKIFLLRLLLGHNKKVVYIQHNLYSRQKFRILSFLINRTCSDFIRITPSTESAVNQFIRIRISFIPNFYLPYTKTEERSAIRKEVRNNLYIHENQELILFSGALKPGKGLEDFLTLAAWFSDRENHRFIIVGDGPEAKKIASYPYKNVIWLGWQAEVEQYLIAADQYFFLSRREMMPMALIEALTLQVPVRSIVSPVNNYLIDNQNNKSKLAKNNLHNLLRRKILHIQVLPKLTGVQRVSLEILRSLPDNEWEKTILFGGAECEPSEKCVEQFRKSGCNVLFSRNLKREIGWYDWRIFWEIYRLCRRERFDVVHTHSTKPGVVGRIAARLAGIPKVIHTVHGVAFHPLVNHWKRATYHAIELFASLFSHRIASVSNYYVKYFHAFSRKTQVIHNGIVFSEKKARQSDSDLVRLLFVGRLEEAKDPLNLLRAFSLIIKEKARKNVRLTLVGDGALEAKCRAFVTKNGLSDKVCFAGWQDDPTPFYANHRIFCLSSIHEAFGICLLEAGAQGLATAATHVGGVPEVVLDGVTGVLVPPRDPEAMAEALLRLIDDPALCRKMGRAAEMHVREHFTVEQMTDSYKKLYTL